MSGLGTLRGRRDPLLPRWVGVSPGNRTCLRAPCPRADLPHAQPGLIGAAPIMGCGAGGSCTPRPPIRQQQAPETRVVAVVFLGLLLDLLAFTLLLPLLPGLLESHGRAHVSPSPPAPLPLHPAMAAPGSQPLRDARVRHASLSPRTPSTAPGSAGWTGLQQPSGCQRRRGTTASCSEVGSPAGPGPPPHLGSHLLALGHGPPPLPAERPLPLGPPRAEW